MGREFTLRQGSKSSGKHWQNSVLLSFSVGGRPNRSIRLRCCDAFLHNRTGLKRYNRVPRNQDFSTSRGVTPFAWTFRTNEKFTEAGNFYWFAPFQKGFDDLEGVPSTRLVESSFETCAFSQSRLTISAFVIVISARKKHTACCPELAGRWLHPHVLKSAPVIFSPNIA